MGDRPAFDRGRVSSFLASRDTVPAVVCDVSFVNGLTAIRTLGRMGVPVIALDHHGSALGFRSRFALPIRCPDPLVDEGGFVSLLHELGDATGVAAIFPTHDPPLNAIARHEAELGDAFLRPFPDRETLALVQSKRVQLERAVTAGVDVPETAYPSSSAEAAAAARAIGFPVLVKPSNPDGFKRRFHRQAFRCDGGAELDRAYAHAESFEPMVQELVPGGDDELYTVGSYIAEDRSVLGLFCGRKLRQTPPGVGTCRVGEARWVDEAVASALGLLDAFSFRGLSQVEFKRDYRDGRYKLMEINPRLWQWHGLAAALGVDFPRIAYLDLIGRRPPPVTTEGRSGRWALTLHAGETPALVRPPYVEPLLALDDPKPALVFLARVARGMLR